MPQAICLTYTLHNARKRKRFPNTFPVGKSCSPRQQTKKASSIRTRFFGAADRTRTDTVSPPRDFKSLASAIPPQRHILFCFAFSLAVWKTHWMSIVHSSAIPPQRHILFCLAFTLAVWKTHWMNIVHSSAIPPQRHIVDFLSSDNENDCSTTDCFCQQLSFDFWALCYFFFFLRSSTVTAEICFKKSASSRLSTRYIILAPSYGKASENP